ncbi:MAG TPA: GNAT family N-acetyltransferase, partial [Kofleriaceae bacterium]|nr:GNAT family N-acetyltransferase [Kofleriaceae bacterium]
IEPDDRGVLPPGPARDAAARVAAIVRREAREGRGVLAQARVEEPELARSLARLCARERGARAGEGAGTAAAAARDSIDLVPVAIDEPRLQALLQDYMQEWSALIAVPADEHGRHVYPDEAHYRDDPSRGVHLFVDGGAGGAPVGFALTMRDASGVRHVEEFFVVGGARRRGLGARVARRLVALAPGAWTLTVRPENPRALAFWRAAFPGAIEALEPGGDGVVRTRLSFEVAAPASPPPPAPAPPA